MYTPHALLFEGIFGRFVQRSPTGGAGANQRHGAAGLRWLAKLPYLMASGTWRGLVLWQSRRQLREQLHSMSDRMLADVGVERADIDHIADALKLPESS